MTVCTQGRHCLFGDVADGQMTLNSCGDIVQACWDDLPHHYPQVKLDAFAVMPNHVHGVILITDAIVVVVGAGFKPAPTSRHWFTGDREGVQDLFLTSNQRTARNVGRTRVAAQLPRAHRSQSGRTTAHPPVRPRQSVQVERGPRQPVQLVIPCWLRQRCEVRASSKASSWRSTRNPDSHLAKGVHRLRWHVEVRPSVEFHEAELIVAPSIKTEGKVYQLSR